MERSPDSHAGKYGWAVLGATVLALDLAMPESLTHAFQRGASSENWLIRASVLGGALVTLAHLKGGIIPKEIDPFYLFLDRIKGQE